MTYLERKQVCVICEHAHALCKLVEIILGRKRGRSRNKGALRPESATERQICNARASRGSAWTVGGRLNGHGHDAARGVSKVGRTERGSVRSANIATCLVYDDSLDAVISGIYVQRFYRVVLPHVRGRDERRWGGERMHCFSVVYDDAPLARNPEEGGGNPWDAPRLSRRAPGLW
ncbi:hypothetical protein OG21DRAFT_1515334 [Imleria badia]|nr:hypothetical protein OG21DRAFT_1515334 [Imleria badia]